MIECGQGGAVVGAREWLPSAPFDFRWAGPRRPHLGCNTIRCDRCGAQVRQQAGLEIDGPDPDPAAAFLSPDLARLPAVRPSELGRLYTCGCHIHVERYATDLQPFGVEVRATFGDDWHCVGHPRLPLPVELDGDLVGPDLDAPALVRQRAASPGSRLPDGLRAEDLDVPCFWLLRLYRLLVHGGERDLADALSRAIAGALDDPDEVVRMTTLTFFNVVPRAAGAERLAAIAGTPAGATRFGGSDWDVGMQMSAALVARLRPALRGGDVDEAALDALKARALGPGSCGDPGIRLLGTLDRAWLSANAVTVARAAPNDVDALVIALRSIAGERLAEIAAAARDLPGADLRRLRETVERELVEPARSMALHQLDRP